ncbi:MAG: phosphoglucomutase/phosphomannomutase family protein [Chloroflexi bacterium]|nr:phosphoglucomutase/phosphomannomutase family protein [Chloroflexota bacterium]MDA1269853.1 phosphoglucomutase/phosphomannomutase family protein [Chloroflexota bacterium]
MADLTDIRFGTDGWRALIANEYTFENVARCAEGLCVHLKAAGTAGKGLVVGYDTRFLSPEFADTVAAVCAAQGVKVYLADKQAPTPVLSYNVLHHQAGGAAIITASHNPAQWNGFKFKPEYAGSATQEITDRLEAAIAQVPVKPVPSMAAGRESGMIVDIDPAPPYLERIASQVNLDAIKSAGLQVVVDAMYGAGLGYLPALLAGGKTTVRELHGHRNPAFPGMQQPEPIAHNLTEISALIAKEGAHGGKSVGIALDGDADRVGIIDEQGRFVTTLDTFSMLAQYLLEQKQQRGALVKGVTSSIALNHLGAAYGVDVHEMRVGFKNIGPKMTEVDALMGGEESGGFAFRGHIPERDGILSGLYILEYMAVTGESPTQLLQRLIDKVGPHSYHRRDIGFQASDRERILEAVNDPAFTEVAGIPILGSDTIDGRRFRVDDGWLAVRFSGTEPLLRIYAEAATPELVEKLLDGAMTYLKV